MNGTGVAVAWMGERGVRSQEFERCQSHLKSSTKVLPDAKSRWPGGSTQQHSGPASSEQVVERVDLGCTR